MTFELEDALQVVERYAESLREWTTNPNKGIYEALIVVIAAAKESKQ